jgi:hypothetical protein
MQVSIDRTIGRQKYTFWFEGANLFETLQQTQHIGFQDVGRCDLCGGVDLYFQAYVTKTGGYKYVKIKCAKCRGTLTLGVAKESGAYFLRKTPDRTLAWENAPESTGGKSSDEAPF